MPSDIGYFGDARRAATGAELVERAVAGGSLVLHQLGNGRAGEMRFHRFLNSPEVRWEEIVATIGRHTGAAARGSRVLAIQDTTEINFGHRRKQPRGLGPGGDNASPGFFIHPVIAVDYDAGALVGIAAAHIWTRSGEGDTSDRHRRAYRDKESGRWLAAMESAHARLQEARQVVMVADREADIYAALAERPAAMDLVVRARHNRQLAENGPAFEQPRHWPVLTTQTVAVAGSKPGKGDHPQQGRHQGRWATVEVRAGAVDLAPPTNSPAGTPTLRLNLVEAREPAPPEGRDGLCWRLLTTLPVASAAAAAEVVDIYRQRWRIEQVFRAIKSDGLGLEETQVIQPEALFKLAAVALEAGVRTIQLVDARDGSSRPASDLLDPDLIPMARAIGRRLEGRTARQQNPHETGSLAWLAWIVARCGGWTCYYKPPGPKTMRRGWDKFAQRLKGYAEALNDLNQTQNP